MCNCKHSTAIEDHRCPIDPSMSVGSRWESGYDDSDNFVDSHYRTAPSSFRSGRSYRIPPTGVATVIPNEPQQRSIADTPELAEGVAIVRRRLDFDDPTFDENGCGLCSRRQTRRSGMTSSCPTRSALSRTRMTSCGKCSKM
uniref:uncharacterized protein LOC127064325 isoform X1 n=1 Tax=Vespula vulgaris TaxID=7454 RepID=UPI002120BBA0|nr:uncharacterized protein LOC127064325 isoform X1 [Vespula vulgaris]